MLFGACGTLTEIDKIDTEAAKAIALKALNLTGEEVSYAEAVLNERDGRKYYDVKITVDGIDVMDITLDSLRRNIGMVSQNVFLFDGTVRDNIAYARPDASDEEIVEAAKNANIHDFILTLDDGYDTEVGERGVKLSGGQRQRISIARVFLKNPKLLILDEATSALDNVTEMQIQASLEELSRGRTVIVVAHRLSTVKNADEIVVIDKTGIVERGSHEELIALGGEYQTLYSYQFRAL
jgi:ATP-binding cassette subfamily B protein